MSTRARPPATTARAGYLVGALVNLALLYLVNVRPGWQAVPFLSADTRQVLPLLNASIVLGLLVNLVYLVVDDPWARAVGDLATAGVGIAVLARLWTVYPFDMDGTSMPVDLPWDLLVRTVLVVALAGSVVGLLVALVRLARAVRGGAGDGDRAGTEVGGRAGG